MEDVERAKPEKRRGRKRGTPPRSLPRRSTGKARVRLASGNVETLPFDEACKTLVENRSVFLSPRAPKDLYAGNNPERPVCFDWSTRIRPKVLFLLDMADSTEITPLSTKAARSVGEHKRAYDRSIIVRDKATGSLYSWWIHDLAHPSRWESTGAEYDSLLDLANELSKEDFSLSESSAIFFNLFGGICSMEKRRVLSTKNRIKLAEIASICDMNGGGSALATVSRPPLPTGSMSARYCLIQAICNLCPSPNVVASFRTYWLAVLSMDSVYEATLQTPEVRPHFATGGYRKLALALSDNKLVEELPETSLYAAANLVGMLLRCHEPLTRSFHSDPERNDLMGDAEMVFLRKLSDSPIHPFLCDVVRRRTWDDLIRESPRIAMAAQSLLVLDCGTMSAEDVRGLVRSQTESMSHSRGPRNQSCEATAAFVKALGLWSSPSILDQDTILEIGTLVARTWHVSQTWHREQIGTALTAARMFASLFSAELWNMLEEDPGAPQHLRPLPKNPLVLQLVHDASLAGAVGELLSPEARVAAATIIRSLAFRVISLGRRLERWKPGSPFGDEDPVDKEEFEEGEILVCWEKCGHACRLENVTGVDMCRECQVCGTVHPMGARNRFATPPGDGDV